MTKKSARKPSLTLAMQNQIKSEYGLGATVAELARKYDRGTSIISRLTNGISRDGERLAHRLADVQRDIKGTHTGHEQSLIIQRSEQIEKIRNITIKGTGYIAKRTLKKLDNLDDDETTFNDLSQAQGVMTKANALVEPKVANQVNVNTQVNVQMSKAKVRAELVAEGIPDDILGYLDD